MNNTELRGKWNKRKRKENIARCYLSAVIIDCYWYCSLFIRLYFNGSYGTQSRRAAIESETIVWNDMSIVMRPYVWSHTLQTWRRFYVNYRQIGRCRRCLSHFIRGNEHSFNEYTFSGHTYPLLGYLYHTHTHAPNATGIMCNQQDKSDGDLWQNFKTMALTLCSSCCSPFDAITYETKEFGI